MGKMSKDQTKWLVGIFNQLGINILIEFNLINRLNGSTADISVAILGKLN